MEIYDLAGNYFEWTQERILNSDGMNNIFFVLRGASHVISGESGAIWRQPDHASRIDANEDTGGGTYYSSRLQLYIK